VHGFLGIAARVCLLVVFCVSVWGKLRSRDAYREFAVSLRAIATPLDRLAPVVIALEAGSAVLLATTHAPGLVVTAGLLTALTAGILWSLQQGKAVQCRCFGAATLPLGVPHAVRNLLLAAIAVIPLAAAGPRPSAAVAAVAIITGVFTSLPAIRLDDLLELAGANVGPRPSSDRSHPS
jgi:hypothetical protein